MRSVWALLVLALVLACGLSSCKSAPVPQQQFRPLEKSERQAIVDGMTESMRARYGAWTNAKAQATLNTLAKRINGGLDVVLLGSERPLVGAGLENHIYVSRGALRRAQYENELAFILAREAAVIASGALEQNVDRHDKDGFYDLPPSVRLAAHRGAVKTLYALGYDPRGAVSLLQRWSTNSGGDDHLMAVRDEIAKLSPMRDPVVNGPLIVELRAALSSKGSGDARRPTVNSRMGWKK